MENQVNSNIAEKLMAHKRGLDGVYLQPTMEECFTEFAKAIPTLTVDPTERQKVELEKSQQKINELERNQKRIDKLEDALDTLMFIANGKEWGHSDEEVNKLWEQFNPKFNEILAEAKKS